MKWIITHTTTQEFLSWRGKCWCPKKRVCSKSAQRRFIHDSPKLETTQVSVNRMDRQIAVYSYHRGALRNQKGWSVDTEQHGFMESERSQVPNANTECSVVPFWWSSGKGDRIYSDRKRSSGASVGADCLERGTAELSGITETFPFLTSVLATQVCISVYIFMVCTSVKSVCFTTGNHASI